MSATAVDNPADQRVVLAAVADETDALRAALAAGGNPDAGDHQPLLYAASYGNRRMLEHLIAFGADLPSGGPRALATAAENQRWAFVYALLPYVPDINAPQSPDPPALSWAAMHGDADATAALLDAGGQCAADHARQRLITLFPGATPAVRFLDNATAAWAQRCVARAAQAGCDAASALCDGKSVEGNAVDLTSSVPNGLGL